MILIILCLSISEIAYTVNFFLSSLLYTLRYLLEVFKYVTISLATVIVLLM